MLIRRTAVLDEWISGALDAVEDLPLKEAHRRFAVAEMNLAWLRKRRTSSVELDKAAMELLTAAVAVGRARTRS